MYYVSTRGGSERVTAAQAIKKGLADIGGLLLPEEFPHIGLDYLAKLLPLSYAERACEILSLFLDGYDKDGLLEDCRAAYGEENFKGGAAPVVKLSDGEYLLELFHGPTCAFKDMALQLMPRLLSRALTITGENRTSFILVATSGDTGKAALEGYRDVPQTKIKVFYPVDGVSDIQKLQMQTQQGENVSVCAIRGNFDDAQNGVKKIFSDRALGEELSKKGYALTSANSINWGRLCPQIVYYISAYLDIVVRGDIKLGEMIDVTVPTGNFGNIFSGFVARKMGLPIRKFICASNKNNVLTDFLKTGIYDRNRPFYQTSSPSMDILISSNLERLLYLCCGAEKTAKYMLSLRDTGRYEIAKDELAAITEVFCGEYSSEEQTFAAIADTYKKYDYLCDPHTAVALSASCRTKCDGVKMLTVSTASPYKFAADVLAAIGGSANGFDGAFAPLYALNAATGVEIPKPLASLRELPVRFTACTDKEKMPEVLLDI